MKKARFDRIGKEFRVDMRPRTFMKKMRLEVLIFAFGLGCAAMLPSFIKNFNKKQRMATEEEMEYVKSQRGMNGPVAGSAGGGMAMFRQDAMGGSHGGRHMRGNEDPFIMEVNQADRKIREQRGNMDEYYENTMRSNRRY